MALWALSLGCEPLGVQRREPPSWDAGPQGYGEAPLPPFSTAPSLLLDGSHGTTDAGDSKGLREGLDAGRSKESPSPTASGSTATPAGQTRDKPGTSGDLFKSRVAALWAAIVEDEPDKALPFFFPVEAYEQVKDVERPARDWKQRLWRAYVRDIHELHQKLGPRASEARLVGLSVPEGAARWVNPGEEYNKLGYYRVFQSQLRFELDGKERAFPVKSLISWRGEWFVVHLNRIH